MTLTTVAAWQPTLDALAVQLDQQYQQTNRRILAGDNPHVHFRKDGSFHVSTPQAEPEDSEPRGGLPQKAVCLAVGGPGDRQSFRALPGGLCPLAGHLYPAKPPDRTFFAGITGYGCFIGTARSPAFRQGSRSGARKYGQRVLHAGQYPWGE